MPLTRSLLSQASRYVCVNDKTRRLFRQELGDWPAFFGMLTFLRAIIAHARSRTDDRRGTQNFSIKEGGKGRGFRS